LILHRCECGPSQRHLWLLPEPTKKSYTHVKLSQYPDGGIARFRLFGIVAPVFPGDKSKTIDLAHVANGGLAVAFSDQHFGKASNLLLPGRGIDMGDGWETRRSRGGEHVDWVVVKLGAEGTIEKVVVDTAHFKGNYPKMVKLEATNSQQVMRSFPIFGCCIYIFSLACAFDQMDRDPFSAEMWTAQRT
jgi:allantoicase